MSLNQLLLGKIRDILLSCLIKAIISFIRKTNADDWVQKNLQPSRLDYKLKKDFLLQKTKRSPYQDGRGAITEYNHQVEGPQTGKYLYHKDSLMGVRVLSPMSGPHAWGSGIEGQWDLCTGAPQDSGKWIFHSWKVYPDSPVHWVPEPIRDSTGIWVRPDCSSWRVSWENRGWLALIGGKVIGGKGLKNNHQHVLL